MPNAPGTAYVRSLAEVMASTVDAYKRCLANNNAEWAAKHHETIALLTQELPSGSGFDNGTTIDLEESSANKLVFHTSFHHMDPHGCYDGWTDHTIIVRPAFIGAVDIRVTGRNRNDCKSYIIEVMQDILTRQWVGCRTCKGYFPVAQAATHAGHDVI